MWARRVSILAVCTVLYYSSSVQVLYFYYFIVRYCTVLVLVPTASHNLCFISTGQLGGRRGKLARGGHRNSLNVLKRLRGCGMKDEPKKKLLVKLRKLDKGTTGLVVL